MNPLTIVITILCGAALIYLGSASFIGRHMARTFAMPRTRSLEYTYEKGLEAEEFTREFFEMISENRFFIDSDLGYRINGVYYAGTDPRKTAVFVHGHTWSWHGMLCLPWEDAFVRKRNPGAE